MDGGSIATFLQRLGFADILLWLLTFAITYGILSQVKIPKNKEVRAIIGIVIGFLVIMSMPAGIEQFVANMSSGFVLILLALLVLLIFFEVMGIKHKEIVPVYDEKGKQISSNEYEVPLFSAHPYILAAAFIIIAILLFVGAGGLNLLGWKLPYNFDITGTIFFVAIILAILYIIQEPGKKK